MQYQGPTPSWVGLTKSDNYVASKDGWCFGLAYMGFETTQGGPFHISEFGVEGRQEGTNEAKCSVAYRIGIAYLRRSRRLNAKIRMLLNYE
jgi:hypothetical protein